MLVPMFGTPHVRLAALSCNAPRKAYMHLLVDQAQVTAILAIARLRRVGIIGLQECYPGQRRAWERSRRVDLVAATPNEKQRGNALAVVRRYGRVVSRGELVADGPGIRLHYPTAVVQLVPHNRRLRRLHAAGWDLPEVEACAAHHPRKGEQPYSERIDQARVIRAGVMTGERPGIVMVDTNDKRLFRVLGAGWPRALVVKHGIDGVVMSHQFRKVAGRLVRSARISDHPYLIVAAGRLPLSR